MRLVLSISLLAAVACATTGTTPATGAAPAVAAIEPRSGSTVTGVATFTAGDAGAVKMHLEVAGAAPGQHGVHIHEKGDCSDPKAASAGAHFNPGGGHHGGPATASHHGGDLGNLEVGADGKGSLDVAVAGLSLDGATDGINGRALVVHEKADDLATDPSGNSGARVGCGVIRR